MAIRLETLRLISFLSRKEYLIISKRCDANSATKSAILLKQLLLAVKYDVLDRLVL